MKEFSLLGFVAELGAIERDIQASGPLIVERACKIIQKKAKSAIGKNHEMWPPLAASTIADKKHHGFPTPKPLLRTGDMRESIEYTARENEGSVGSNSDVAVFQELGTSRIPPRSFLVSSAINSEDKIVRMATAATVSAFSGYGHHARDTRELIENIRRAGHALYELGHDLLEDEDERDEK